MNDEIFQLCIFLRRKDHQKKVEILKDWSDENQVRYFTQEWAAIESILQYVVVNSLQRRLSKGSIKGTVAQDCFFSKHFNQYFLSIRSWFSRSFKSFLLAIQILILNLLL